ncbi:sulfotransferase 2B1-like isoform X3 [Pelodiscus sinensis]|uniref:sulfotransferase 2B1-like isoform X3 n=1 Tax=Pelodiscus sinensis TaxID=13735 RepID=UPI003F6C50C5
MVRGGRGPGNRTLKETAWKDTGGSMADPGPRWLRYEGLLLPALVHSAESLRYARLRFQVRDQDVFSITYPKSGTTWMQELLTLIHSDGDPQLAQSVPSWERVPWLEQITAAGYLENRPCPRLVSSHLPCDLFPSSIQGSNAKVIYTMRNPKDVCVSLYYYSKMASFLETQEDFGEFVEQFSAGKGPAGQRAADLPVPGQGAGGAGAGRGGGQRLLPGHEAEQDVQLQPGAPGHHGPADQPLPEKRGAWRLEGALHGSTEPGL